MFSFLTLLSSFLSFLGIGKIYHGKLSEDSKETMKGIIYTFIGLLGITCFNPIFDSMILSILSGIVFMSMAIGYISYTFLNTKPESIIAKAELLDKEDDNKNIEIREEKEYIVNNSAIEEHHSSLPIPVKLSKMADLIKIKIK